MSLILVLGLIIIFQDLGANSCLPRKTKELTDSYVPVGIQVLNHFKSQLQMYHPYTFTELCQRGENTVAIPQFASQSDVCVAESVARINLFLIDLQREAAKQNLQESQGLSRLVLTSMEKTSQGSAAQQFYFILTKLQNEEISSRGFNCKIVEFLQDLKNPNSKLNRNLLNVKPLNYLIENKD